MNFENTKIPSYKYLKLWVCVVKVMAPLPNKMNIGPEMIDSILIGYTENSLTY